MAVSPAMPVQRRALAVTGAVLRAEPREHEEAEVHTEFVPAQETAVIAVGVELTALKDGVCRWPIGDPASEGFRFCGRSCPHGQPYCEGHAARAFHGRALRPR